MIAIIVLTKFCLSYNYVIFVNHIKLLTYYIIRFIQCKN